MQQPTIEFEGKDYPVSTISWQPDGTVQHLCFTDEQDTFHCAWNSDTYHYSEGYRDGLLHLNFSKKLKWGECVG